MNTKNMVDVTALKGLIKVNSFFSIATILSIIITIPSSSNNVHETRLLIYLAFSFGFFVFAWLLAQCMMLAAVKECTHTKHMVFVRGGIMVTALFSGAGFYMLVISLMKVTGATKVQMLWTCEESSIAGAVGCMGGLVFIGLSICLVALCYVVFRGKGHEPDSGRIPAQTPI